MTRCYLDTNFLFMRVRVPEEPQRHQSYAAWAESVDADAGDDSLITSGLVVDELAYRLTLTWLRDDGVADPLAAFRADERSAMVRVRDRLGEVFADVNASVEYFHSNDAVVIRAQQLMGDPGLAPRDAFHAAHAIEGRCECIVSADDSFDAVPGLRRIGP